MRQPIALGRPARDVHFQLGSAPRALLPILSLAISSPVAPLPLDTHSHTMLHSREREVGLRCLATTDSQSHRLQWVSGRGHLRLEKDWLAGPPHLTGQGPSDLPWHGVVNPQGRWLRPGKDSRSTSRFSPQIHWLKRWPPARQSLEMPRIRHRIIPAPATRRTPNRCQR